MGLITEWFEVKLNSANVNYYGELGYIEKNKKGKYSIKNENNNTISVHFSHLSVGSCVYADCECDNCGKPNKLKWPDYLKTVKDDGSTYCKSCSRVLFGLEKRSIKYLENNESFYDWCIRENSIYCLKRWDDELNKLNPRQVSFASDKKYYFKCPKGIHESELKSINNFVHNHSGVMNCIACNTLYENYKNYVYLWSELNETSPKEHYKYAIKKVWWKCENNLHDDYFRSIKETVLAEFRCSQCVKERTESLLQEKVRLYLEKLSLNHVWVLNHEYNTDIFCINPKTKTRLLYDNEIITNNIIKIIIEVNGFQHYYLTAWHIDRAKKTGLTPKQEFEYAQWKDEYKKQYALDNGYYYLAIPFNTDDKNETWKYMIDNMLKEITEGE